MKMPCFKIFCLVGFSASIAMLLTACAANKETVIAMTGTVIGVQIHQKDTDKTPELKLGYVRSEFAYVPTDKRLDTNAPSGSATNSSEVLMEINAGGSITLGSVYQGAIYQRLAVGRVAVSQPGAAFMVARDVNGKLNPTNAEAIQKAMSAYSDEIAARHIQGNALTDIARLRVGMVSTTQQFNQALSAATSSGVLEDDDAKKLLDGLTVDNLNVHKNELKKYFHSSSSDRNKQFEKFNEFMAIIVN